LSQDRYQKTGIVSGFVGENLNAPHLLLPPTVSPAALNCDYKDGFLKKRLGFRRRDDRPIFDGSVRVRNVAENTYYARPTETAMTSTDWALEFTWSPYTFPATGDVIVDHMNVAATAGFKVYYVSNTNIVLDIVDAGGTQTLTCSNVLQTSLGDVRDRAIYGCFVAFRETDTPGTYKVSFYCQKRWAAARSATLESSNAYTVNTGGYYNLGCPNPDGAGSQTSDQVFDEVRLWDLTGDDDAAFATWVAEWEEGRWARELTETEAVDSRLVKSYPCDGSQSIDLAGVASTAKFYEWGGASYWHGLVLPRYSVTRPKITGCGWLPAQTSVYAASYSGIPVLLTRTGFVGMPINSAARYMNEGTPFTGTRWLGATTLTSVYAANPHPWVTCTYAGRLIAVNLDVGSYRIETGVTTDLFMYALTPDAPLTANVTATETAGGTGPGASKTYIFKFYLYDSYTGVVSEAGPNTASVTVSVDNYAIQLNNVSLLFAKRDVMQIRAENAYLRIFRTRGDGSEFFWVQDVALTEGYPATTPYTSADINVADGSEGDSEALYGYTYVAGLDDFTTTTMGPWRFCFVQNGYLILGNNGTSWDGQDEIIWSEPGRVDSFYAFNTLQVGQSGEALTGGVSVQGTALLTKAHELYLMTGTSPSTWILHKWTQEVGVLEHNTLAVSGQAVYGLASTGIVRIPLPLGSAPPAIITTGSMDSLFADMDPDDHTASGAFDPARDEYWLVFNSGSSRITVVYDEQTGSLRKLDLAVDCFMVEKAASPRLLAAWKGQLVEINSGNNDGATHVADSSGAISQQTPTLTGTVTSADTDSITAVGGNFWEYPRRAVAYYTSYPVTPVAGMSGLKLVVTASDGTTQTRTIYFNTESQLWVTEAWDTIPSVGDTYVIAGIDWHWKSPKLDLTGLREEEVHIQRLHTWFGNTDASTNVQVDIDLDGSALDDSPFTVSIAARHSEELMNGRGREVEIQYSNDNPDEPVTIEGFRVGFDEGTVRP